MSEHDKLTVVLIVSMTLGALVDRITALSMIAGVICAVDFAEPAIGRQVHP